MNRKVVKEWALMLVQLILGCAIFSLGFDLFLAPHSINAGGLSGLAQIVVHLTGLGTVGLWVIAANIPLFIFGGLKIGKKFFVGSLVGALAMSLMLDLFAFLPAVPSEPLLGSVYGGLLTGAGMGLVYLSGASSGGSDIVVRLVKLRMRNAPIGVISFAIDACVVILTGITFRSVANILYCGVVLYVTTVVMDAVIYRFDYSKVALIISGRYEEIAHQIWVKLDRGVTYLYGQGAYSGTDTKVVLVAVKRQQLAELKQLVVEIDPDAFIILQESHQVLGDGFLRYSDKSL